MKSIKYPLVTIITPTYNQGQFIEETIRSVLSQTYPNIEYIVLDAMSTDSTPEIIQKYSDRIAIVRREPDNGQSDAIAKGFKLATGELVGWINSDDLLYPDCVERIVQAYLRQPEAVLFYCSSIDIISESGKHLSTMNVPLVSREHLMRVSNTLIQPGSFYRKKVVEQVNYFNTELRYSMDLDLWLRLLSVGGFVDVHDVPIAAYREWGGTKTATGGVQMALERMTMLTKHGGTKSDPAQRQIRANLIKNKLKSTYSSLSSIFRPFCKVLWFLSFILYYGVLIHLPATNSRYTRWLRPIRGSVCRLLFKSSGYNINVEKGARFGSGDNVTIGNNSGLGINCLILGTVSLGNDVMMGPDVMFISTSHCFDRIDIPMIEQGLSEELPIVVENDVWIGARCILLPGITLGTGSVIGAGSVVTKSVPAFTMVAGNPARVIRSRSQCQ